MKFFGRKTVYSPVIFQIIIVSNKPTFSYAPLSYIG